ncbi:hypothetical protein SCHPADRAFT_439071 [Schizopora paradoxa]|uniref:DUF6534 domain-containing protein n=1 Tax=Schizopora paradoxa TaxID=27342 RepID=A0A0H2RJ65_9AGAM|nr:hypothetical protein SCHPADRAFT_439071 [Schizopora paradoxa]
MTVIDTSAGAVFIALVLTSILFGVTWTQAIHYYQRCKRDSMVPIIAVTGLLLMDTAFMSLVAYGSYVFVVKAIGDLTVLLLVPRALAATVLLSLSSVFLVRGFFLHRIWLLSNRNLFVLVFNSILLFGSYGLGLYSGIRILGVRFTPELANLSWEIYCIMCPGIAEDFYIASMMCYYLFRSRNEFPKTNSLMNSLAAYAINTGLLTVIWDSCMIISYATANHTLIFIIFFLSLSKLYINALLASLNSRPAMRRQAERVGFSSFRLSESGRFRHLRKGRRVEPQESELESAVETIDIRLPSASELEAGNSKVSLEWSVKDLPQPFLRI